MFSNGTIVPLPPVAARHEFISVEDFAQSFTRGYLFKYIHNRATAYWSLAYCFVNAMDIRGEMKWAVHSAIETLVGYGFIHHGNTTVGNSYVIPNQITAEHIAHDSRLQNANGAIFGALYIPVSPYSAPDQVNIANLNGPINLWSNSLGEVPPNQHDSAFYDLHHDCLVPRARIFIRADGHIETINQHVIH
jgi:hypothetical protein